MKLFPDHMQRGEMPSRTEVIDLGHKALAREIQVCSARAIPVNAQLAAWIIQEEVVSSCIDAGPRRLQSCGCCNGVAAHQGWPQNLESVANLQRPGSLIYGWEGETLCHKTL